jgi:hypothetical protein
MMDEDEPKDFAVTSKLTWISVQSARVIVLWRNGFQIAAVHRRWTSPPSAHSPVPVESDLDGDQHGRGGYKKQGDCIEGRVEGDHGGLTNDDPVQQVRASPAGHHGVHSSCSEHGCRRRQPLADRGNACGDVGAKHRNIGGDVDGFEVAIVRDAVAGAKLPEGDGYLSALINFRFIANGLWTADEAISRLNKKV